MAITPADIDQLTFSPSKHGYDTEEVDTFLEQLSVELDAMLTKIADLKGRLNACESQLAQANARLEAKSEVAPVVSERVVEVESYGATERQISQVLIVAQQSADKILADAREAADHIRTEADQKAREVIRQALAEKQQELDEIDRLKASREEFRAEYKNLLQHFMDDAEAAFPNSVLSSQAHPVRVEAKPVVKHDPQSTVYAPLTSHAPVVGVDDLD